MSLVRQQSLAEFPSQNISVPQYSVLYPDRSWAKVNKLQHKQMMDDGVLAHIDGHRFRYIGHAFHFRNLADLRLYYTVITTSKRFKNYPGLFIWMHKRRRSKETLEPPEAMAARLKLEAAK